MNSFTVEIIHRTVARVTHPRNVITRSQMFFRCFVSSTEAGRAKFLSVRDKQQLSWLRNQWSELGRQNGDGGGGGGRSALTSEIVDTALERVWNSAQGSSERTNSSSAVLLRRSLRRSFYAGRHDGDEMDDGDARDILWVKERGSKTRLPDGETGESQCYKCEIYCYRILMRR